MDVRLSAIFSRWLSDLRDVRARDKIITRIRRFEIGNLGDNKSVGDGVSEARIGHGPGYRLYFVRRERVLIILLCGGTKRTQTADIAQAKSMAQDLT